MTCAHPAATITDHIIQNADGATIHYAWRGVCTGCQRGVVGVTALPVELPEEQLTTRLTGELAAYLTLIAAMPGV